MSKNYASKVVKIALDEVGYLEKKSNTSLNYKTKNAGRNNFTKYANDLDTIKGFYFGKKNGYEWCAVFVDWCFVQAFGVDEMKRMTNHTIYGASCTRSADKYAEMKRLYKTAKVGDEVFFLDKDGDAGHTGIVTKVTGHYIYTIEGNTSKASGVVANGGGVAEKKYAKTEKIFYGFGRPLYDKEPVKNNPVGEANQNVIESVKESIKKARKFHIQAWQIAARKDGYSFPRYGADGEWGAECERVAKKAILHRYRWGWRNRSLVTYLQTRLGINSDGKFGRDTDKAVRKFQKEQGLTVDGYVGINTWKKLLGVS